MSISTVLKYLVGYREAILQIGRTPGALWLGALFVLSAGFAREYDGKDLWAEPWHLVVPFAASLATSFLLFSLVYGVARRRGIGEQPFLPAYRSFLALYWMTAPLAWLYAIPVERMLAPGDAMQANLWLLGTVAVWRVALMTRVVSVLYGASTWAALWPVMLFADSVALVALFLTPLPVFNVMGGVRLSEREQVIVTVVFFFSITSVATWLLWFLGTMRTLEGPRTWQYALAEARPVGKVSRPLWILGGCTIAVWLPILPRTQPEQRLRHAVEMDFSERRIADAVSKMSAHRLADFPPHWDPPPHVAYAEEDQLPLLDVLEVAIDPGVPAWIQDIYADKLENQMRAWSWFENHRTDLGRLLTILQRMPRGQEALLANADRLDEAKLYWPQQHPEDKDFAIDAEALLDWAGYKPPREPAGTSSTAQ
jgi:hypothetical protein